MNMVVSIEHILPPCVLGGEKVASASVVGLSGLAVCPWANLFEPQMCKLGIIIMS